MNTHAQKPRPASVTGHDSTLSEGNCFTASPDPKDVTVVRASTSSQPLVSPTPTAVVHPYTTGASSNKTPKVLASNFFRRYSPSAAGQAAVKNSIEVLSDSSRIDKAPFLSEGKGSDEAGGRLSHPLTSLNADSGFTGLDRTVAVNSTSINLGNHDAPNVLAKLHKPTGRNRKGSRAPPPPPPPGSKLYGAQTSKHGSGKRSKLEGPPQRPCQAHSFHTDTAEIQKMEKELFTLLDDFNSGKLRAFGQGCSMEQMEGIRDQQERLAKLHFELGSKQDLSSTSLSEDGTRAANENMDGLMTHLERLSVAIGKLNPDSPSTDEEVNDKHDKKYPTTGETVVFSIHNQPIEKGAKPTANAEGKR